VASEDETLNTIETPYGTSAGKIMPQGDTNGAFTAIGVMEYILDGLIGKTVLAYVYNNTIFSDSIEYNVRDICQLCQRLQDHYMRVFPSKWNFFADSLLLLGHVIDGQGMHAHLEEIQGIQD